MSETIPPVAVLDMVNALEPPPATDWARAALFRVNVRPFISRLPLVKDKVPLELVAWLSLTTFVGKVPVLAMVNVPVRDAGKPVPVT